MFFFCGELDVWNGEIRCCRMYWFKGKNPIIPDFNTKSLCMPSTVDIYIYLFSYEDIKAKSVLVVSTTLA